MGKVEMWYFDIGCPVKKKNFARTIDTPDTRQQYAPVRGDPSTSEFDSRLAAGRLCAAQAVSQQTVDEKVGGSAASGDPIEPVRLYVGRARAMEDVENIMVPFDGHIVWRPTVRLRNAVRAGIVENDTRVVRASWYQPAHGPTG